MELISAGESHGPGYTGILKGLPAGMPVKTDHIAEELSRRRNVAGRSSRQKIEKDECEIVSGLLDGETTGGALGLVIKNRAREIREMTVPRPGHIDLAGFFKYGGIKGMLWASERASARETVIRVAAGAIIKQFLHYFDISVWGWVEAIGGIHVKPPVKITPQTRKLAEQSPVYCPQAAKSQQMLKKIHQAQLEGETLGGIFTVVAEGFPPGLGEVGIWQDRLDARITQGIMSIPSVKGLEIGSAFEVADLPGSLAQDPIEYDRGFKHRSNLLGGVEGGLSNGSPIVIRAAVKPVPTNRKAVASVDVLSHQAQASPYYRSDTCAVPAALVIAEAVMALVLGESLKKKLGGDTLQEMLRRYREYRESFS